jgi:hypothetical protein
MEKIADMPRKGDLVRIPLKTEEALRLALKVKPTADVRRPRPTKAKKRKK